MASSSRTVKTAEEALRRVMMLSIDDNDSEVEIDEESDDDVDHVAEEDSSPTESPGESSDEDEAADNRLLIAPSGMEWKLDAPRLGRTTAANISLPAALTNTSQNVDTVTDAFRLFFTDDVIHMLIQFTNKFARSVCNVWKDVDEIEMIAFLGLLLLRGVCRAKRESVEELWSTEGSFARPLFAATMSRARFEQLLRYLRFDDRDTRAARAADDKLAAIRDLYEKFASNCRSSFRPGPYITIDEQLVVFRGRCPFRMYIPSKPGKYGLKVWVICDAKTSYCSNLQVYTGKTGNQREVNQASRVVMELAAHLLDTGRNITMDNFFTGVPLTQELLTRRTTVVGTLRKNKKDIPKRFTETKGRASPSTLFAFSDQLTLCSYCPKKNKIIPMLSSMHHDAAISLDNPAQKPHITLCYNETKSGVDNLDKLVREYSTRCTTRRWPMVLFQSWLDIAAYNALVIYTFKHPDKFPHNRARRRFLTELGMSLVKPLMERRAQRIVQNPKGHRKHTRRLLELCGIQFPPDAPPRPAGAAVKRGRCVLCVRSDLKHSSTCDKCGKFFCSIHRIFAKTEICVNCSAEASDESDD